MAHFAEVDSNNLVVRVSAVNNDKLLDSEGKEQESIGISFLKSILNSENTWIQTSYNNNFRGNYAGIGYTYMQSVETLGVASTDIFIQQQPFPSWSIGIQTAAWYPPIPKPELSIEEMTTRKDYYWDESLYQSSNTSGWIATTV